jgi:hypothetical protein
MSFCRFQVTWDSSGSTFDSEFGRFIHDNKLGSKIISLEVLAEYDVAIGEGLQLQAWNSIRRGAYYSYFDKCRLIYETTNMLGQTGRCSLEFFTGLEDLSADA